VTFRPLKVIQGHRF